jgi:hypothetical protein
MPVPLPKKAEFPQKEAISHNIPKNNTKAIYIFFLKVTYAIETSFIYHSEL